MVRGEGWRDCGRGGVVVITGGVRFGGGGGGQWSSGTLFPRALAALVE